MSMLRLRRLQSDYECVRLLARSHSKIELKSVRGSPPEYYRLTLKVRSLRERGGTIEFADVHLLEVRLPQAYPRDAPVCRMLTPVFHPNIAPHAVCIGDHWAAEESLDALVVRVCEMLAFQSYNIKSPLNGEAAKWVEENLQKVPLDRTSFLIIDEEHSPAVADDERAVCSNCGDQTEASLRRCDRNHLLCSACAAYCKSCGQLLCMLCGVMVCRTCRRLADAGYELC